MLQLVCPKQTSMATTNKKTCKRIQDSATIDFSMHSVSLCQFGIFGGNQSCCLSGILHIWRKSYLQLRLAPNMHKLTECMLKSIVELCHLYYLACLFVGCCHGMFLACWLRSFASPTVAAATATPIATQFLCICTHCEGINMLLHAASCYMIWILLWCVQGLVLPVCTCRRVRVALRQEGRISNVQTQTPKHNKKQPISF